MTPSGCYAKAKGWSCFSRNCSDGLGLPELIHVQTSRGQSPNSMPLGSSLASPRQPLSPLSIGPWARQRGESCLARGGELT